MKGCDCQLKGWGQLMKRCGQLMKGWGQSVRRQGQHWMNSAAPLCLRIQGRSQDGHEGVEEEAGPWILLSLDTHIQSLYNVNKNGPVVCVQI